MGQKVTLANTHLDLVAPITWGQTLGVDPLQTVVVTDATEAAGILSPANLGKASSLTILDDGGKSNTFNQVYILGEVPVSTHHYRGILISDRRWKWNRAWVTGRYNIRRWTGGSHLAAEDNLVPLQIAQNVDEFQLAPWSDNNGSRWKPADMLSDVLSKVQAADNFTYDLDTDIPDSYPVNDLRIDDPGGEAIRKALRHIPGADLYISKAGGVRVINTLSGKELDVIKSIPFVPNYQEGVLPKRAFDFSGVRPGKIVVYIIKNHELRLDNVVEGSTYTDDDSRVMQNVFPVTDPSLNLTNGQTVGNGTIVDVDSLFGAWNADAANLQAQAPPISHQIVQQGFFEDGLLNVYVPWGSGNPQPIWLGRIESVFGHYRKTYRIQRKIMDRLEAVLPVRAALLDITTGQRGRALAFSDYCVEVTSRNVQKDPEHQFFFENVVGWNAVLANGNVAPAKVSVLDEQIGLIHVDYVLDLYGRTRRIYPSQLINVPSADMSDINKLTCHDETLADGTIPQLATNHRIAIVLTAVPAAPNDKSQYFSIEVSPADAKGYVPGDIGACNGPTWEVFVRPGVLQARFAWSDTNSAVIERSLGIGKPTGVGAFAPVAAGGNLNDDKILQSLMVNYDDCKTFAQAIAATMWARMVDRPLGQAVTRFTPTLEIQGAVKRIMHTVMPDGTAKTSVEVSEELKELDPLGYVPEALQRVLQREVI